MAVPTALAKPLNLRDFARAPIASIAHKATHRTLHLGASPFTRREKPRKREVIVAKISSAAE
jgi:hypothetical protein